MSSALKVKKNQKGGYYTNGKSLPMEVRAEIVQRFVREEKVTKIAKDMKLTHGVVSKITQHYRKTGLIAPRNVKSVNETTVTVPKPKNKLLFSVESILSQPTTTATSTASTPSSVSSTTSNESVNFSTSPTSSDGSLSFNLDVITLMALAQLNLTTMPPMQQVPIVPPPQIQALQMQMDAIAWNQWLVNACQLGFRQ
uniref:Paired domain-containing protein n=1 Tax=Panagrellus redivivus TaxID=6233 RepID=A0A7E4W557_PANRE